MRKEYPRSIRRDFTRTRYWLGGGLNGDGSEIKGHTPLQVTDYREGFNNPNWRDQIRKHRNATTRLEGERIEYVNGVGMQEARFLRNTNPPKVAFVRDVGAMSGVPIPTIPAFRQDVYDEALMKFLKNVKRKQTAFRGLTFAGELGETLRMLRNPARGLRRGIDEYFKDVKKRAKKARRSPSGRPISPKKRNSATSRAVADTWLEHAFGWAPLIGSVKDAGEAINKRLERYSSDYARVSSRADYVTSSYTTTWSSVQSQAIGRAWRRITFSRCSVRFYGQVRSYAENPKEADRVLFGTNWTEIIPTAWELIPYSFLVDYFTNIGDVLDGLSIRKSDIAWMARTLREQGQNISTELRIIPSEAEEWPGSVNETIVHTLSGKPSMCKRTHVDRQSLSVIAPVFRFEIPGTSRKFLNISALAASRASARRHIFS